MMTAKIEDFLEHFGRTLHIGSMLGRYRKIFSFRITKNDVISELLIFLIVTCL